MSPPAIRALPPETHFGQVPSWTFGGAFNNSRMAMRNSVAMARSNGVAVRQAHDYIRDAQAYLPHAQPGEVPELFAGIANMQREAAQRMERAAHWRRMGSEQALTFGAVHAMATSPLGERLPDNVAFHIGNYYHPGSQRPHSEGGSRMFFTGQ